MQFTSTFKWHDWLLQQNILSLNNLVSNQRDLQLLCHFLLLQGLRSVEPWFCCSMDGTQNCAPHFQIYSKDFHSILYDADRGCSYREKVQTQNETHFYSLISKSNFVSELLKRGNKRFCLMIFKEKSVFHLSLFKCKNERKKDQSLFTNEIWLEAVPTSWLGHEHHITVLSLLTVFYLLSHYFKCFNQK